MIKALADIHFPHLPISLIYIIVGLVICHASALLFWVYSALKRILREMPSHSSLRVRP